MFRGGPVDSRGTGITSGLMDGGRVGLKSSFPGTAGQAQEFLTGGDIVDLSKTKFIKINSAKSFKDFDKVSDFRS